jgi:hypothetical protein
MSPNEILEKIYRKATLTLNVSGISNHLIRERINYVCKCTNNRAGARLLMSCLLGKLDNPKVDLRKPYTEIGGDDSFSGRTYDERFLTSFISKYQLPLNPTTAFLTPTLRNIDHPLTINHELVGRPRDLYIKTIELLEDVVTKKVTAEKVFVETLRVLILLRDEKLARIESLLSTLQRVDGALPLSSERIITLISQHLACKNASRLPVLVVVAAAYQTVGIKLQEEMLPLHSHTAADLQTGSIGDVEICLINEKSIVTAYEMKMRRVTRDDIDVAVSKLTKSKDKIHNYLFITTEHIDLSVSEYASSLYEKTDGIEIAVLDCIGFLKHFLHLFHRVRVEYLNTYQKLVLNEPDSAISPSLKEAFLALRQSSESDT